MSDSTDKKNGTESTTAVVTKVSAMRKPADHPLMSFTAVVSHQTMAEAFLNEMLRVAQKLIPDHTLTGEELLSIIQRALYDQGGRSITMVNGRHLRARISEQVSRASRYNEYFSLIVLNLDEIQSADDYEAIVDTLRERMRKTDLIFLFKHRIVLLLPHTGSEPCEVLKERIQSLIAEGMASPPDVPINTLTFPNETMAKSMQVLDWTENMLRS